MYEQFKKALENKITLKSKSDWFGVIKEDLPHFPDEIINDFLLQYAIEDSWPPVLTDRWVGRMRKKTIEDWNNYRWEKVEYNLTDLEPNQQMNQIISELYYGYVHGQKNLHANAMGDVGKQKFLSIKDYMEEHKVFPKPIIIYKDGDHFDILDGCHRLTTWKHLYEIGIVSKNQQVWLGKKL